MWLSAPVAMVASGVAAAIALLFIDAPYGKFGPDKANHWGPLIPARWAWFVQESPSIVLMLLYAFVWADPAHASATPNEVLAFLFCFHYFVRAWIFPFLLNASKPAPLLVVAMAFGFCMFNGWMQGSYLFTSSETMPKAYASDWLGLWRVRAGIGIFFAGWCINQHADHVLRHLRDKPAAGGTAAAGGEKSAEKDTSAKARKDGSESQKSGGGGAGAAGGDAADCTSPHKRYRIPYGGMFRYTSAANYTGEIIEWGGWALAAWNGPALAFWIFTILNLAPRALSSHRWYKTHFKEYPKDRKAVIPFVL